MQHWNRVSNYRQTSYPKAVVFVETIVQNHRQPADIWVPGYFFPLNVEIR